jgi:hypothetical protein
MFEVTVIGLDGSDSSRAALPVAVGLARHDGAGLVLAHAEQEALGKGA